MIQLVIIGPTSLPWTDIADDVEDDLRALRRPGIEIDYVTTGAGPTHVHSERDELEASPHVVATARRVAAAYDAVIVDCTGDPGVEDARAVIDVPIVGAGEAMRWAAERSPQPSIVVTGDALRSVRTSDLARRHRDAATIVIGGTGHRRTVDALRATRPDRTVVEPLEAAVEWCVDRLAG